MASKARDLSNFISVATIDASEIASSAITTDKIADVAVTHAKLHSDLNLSGKSLTFAADQISGNAIDGGVISNFTSTGIDDNATSTALTISSSGVISGDGSGLTNIGTKVFADPAAFIAHTGMTAGDQAFVESNKNIYIYSGSAWYKIATALNLQPTSITGIASTYYLDTDSTPTIITAVSSDPEGFPLTWSSSVSSGALNGTTVTNVDNVFTITPHSSNPAIFSLTFTATDTATGSVSASSGFTLDFVRTDESFNAVSFLSSFNGSNNGGNNSFNDSSASNHTITANGNATQGSFSPFARPAGEWSVDTGATSSNNNTLVAANHGDFNIGTGNYTVELFVNFSEWDNTNQRLYLMGVSGVTNISLDRDSGANTLKVYSNGGAKISYNYNPTLNSWHHIAVVRSSTGANGLSLYIDGTRVAQGTDANTISAHTFNIGGLTWAGGYGTRGFISNFRFVVGTAVYTGSSFTVPTSPLTAIANTKLLTCQSNSFVDNSPSAHTVTPTGNLAISAFSPILTSSEYVPAVNGASAYFDGNGDYLSIPSNANLDFGTGDFTIECWVYSEPTTNTYPSFISSITGWSAGASGHRFDNINYANKFWFGLNGSAGVSGGDPFMASASTFMHYAWYHYALVRTGNTWKMYINGALEATGTYSGAFNQALGGMRVGASGPWDGAQAYSKGNVSNLRIVKGTAVYTSAFTAPTAPVTAIANTSLLLNMADGQAIDNAVQNNLTLFGNAKLSTTQSKFGGASMYFDGTGDYATLYDPKAGHFGSGNFTAECWVYPTASPSQPIIFGQWSGSYSWALQMQNSNSRYLRFLTNAGGIVDNQSSTAVPLNQWSHVALVRNGNAVNAYLNGTSVVSSTVTGAFVNSTDALSIGGGVGGGQPYEGYIDKVRITKGLARYTANFTPPSEPFPDLG